MYRNTCVIFFIIFLFSAIMMNAQSDNIEKLKLKSAVDVAINNNPELELLRKEISALESVKLQSGLYPNPEFDFEAENIFGQEHFSGFKGSEISAKISQDILLSGKKSKRTKIAEADITLAEWDYEVKRLEIITDVRKAFVSALSTQTILEKNKELINISNELISNLEKRVEAGKISPAEVSRAMIILNSLKIELIRLQSEYDISIAELQSLLNKPDLSFTSIEGSLELVTELPKYDSLVLQLKNNPSLKRYESEYEKQHAVIIYEESKAIPDINISAGYKRLNEVKANTFLIGASIPIPIFDRNQGSIQEAQIRSDQKRIEKGSIENKLKLNLNVLYKRFYALFNTSEELKNKSIPQAQEAFKIIKEGNQAGRFAILDIIDAERTLFELQNQYLRMVGDMVIVKTEIEGLIGKEIN